MDDEQWLRLICAFDGAKDFRVAGDHAADILRALRSANEGHETVLPSLRNLYLQGPVSIYELLRDSVRSFLTQRRLSGRPIQAYSPESMFASLTQGGVNVTAPSSILTQSAGAIPIRRPTTKEVASAKRWVEDQRRIAFHHNFDGVAPVPESEIPKYIRKLEHLDMVLGNIERYIHIAFAALRKEDVVRRMFNMMASTKCQLEECKKPNPRYVLELHTIQGMIQEAENMDKGLRTVLGLKLAAHGNSPVPQKPQQPTRTLWRIWADSEAD
ncbi:hypothetical protein EDB85DRAFT_2037195 [Lactarius pseudohatsudake]|nr:hypothetical protein EDB85DRAFT_2037195 [Lactarius pseudohatsudake]